MHQLVKIAGALLVLSGFVLVQFGVPRPTLAVVPHRQPGRVGGPERTAHWTPRKASTWAIVSAIGFARSSWGDGPRSL